jgi:SnoaL-like protein
MSDTLAQAAMESACRQAMSLYLVAVDTKNIDLMLQAFHPDAVWVRPGMAPMHGHAEIRRFFEAILQKHAAHSVHGHLTRHCLTTISVTATEDAMRASGVAYALVYRDPTFNGVLPAPMPEPELLVEYRDTFAHSTDGWRILQHEARHIFRSERWGQQLSSKELATLHLKEGK